MKGVGMKQEDGSRRTEVREDFIGARKLFFDEAHPLTLRVGNSQGHRRALRLLLFELTEEDQQTGKMVNEDCVFVADVLVQQLCAIGLGSSLFLHCLLTVFLLLRFISLLFSRKFNSPACLIHLHHF
jgi:hypothetical protein